MVTPAPRSEGSQALAPMSSHVHCSETPPPPFLPLSDVSFIGTPLVGCSWIPHQSPVCKVGSLPQQCTQQSTWEKACAETAEAKASSGHSTPQGSEELPKCHWKCMTMVWVPLRAPKRTTTGTALIMVEQSTQENQGRMQPTLIRNWPQGIVSLVQTWKSEISEQHNRDSRRGYRPPVALQGAGFGQRPR